MNRHVYTQLAARGFRRSGEFLYQPRCRNCHACIPVRVPVRQYLMRKSDTRIYKRNRDLKISIDLYCRYINTKHKGGGMDNPKRSDYMGFLSSSWMDTMFYEMKLNDNVIAVAVVDLLDDALSAVYTFYDPDCNKRSLGTFAILLEIREAVRLGLNWVYLGYWIEGCTKMNYKNQFRPIEYLQDNIWVRSPG
jgi:arginine-tRNA-protein transferase